jgi:hypothetical protein
MVDLSLNGQFRACSTNRKNLNVNKHFLSLFVNAAGKTALTDANRKKENSFNRCQSEKRKQL